ncbi:MAG: hypothetical protein R2688_05325 [Fimbriimonadaceae bacterium]
MKIGTNEKRIIKISAIVLVVAVASTALGSQGQVVSEDAGRAALPLILASGLLLARLGGKTSENRA